MFGKLLDRLFSTSCKADDLHLIAFGNHGSNANPHDGMVVDDKDFDQPGCGFQFEHDGYILRTGRLIAPIDGEVVRTPERDKWMSTDVPICGVLLILNDPPKTAMRSLIP